MTKYLGKRLKDAAMRARWQDYKFQFYGERELEEALMLEKHGKDPETCRTET